MVKNIRTSLNYHKVLTFPKESIDGLTGEMYVDFNIRRESNPNVTWTDKDLTIVYDLKGHKALGFRKTKYFYAIRKHFTDDQHIYKIWQGQPNKLDKEVYDFLQKNLPKYMKKLIPEQK